MRPSIPDEKFERRNVRRYIFCVGLAVILSQCWIWPGITVRIIAGFVGLAAGFAIATALEKLDVQYHKCSKCGARIGLGEPGVVNTARIILTCPNCNIDWDLGLPAVKSDAQKRLDGDFDNRY